MSERYDSTEEDPLDRGNVESAYHSAHGDGEEREGLFRTSTQDSASSEAFEMSVKELLYSTASFHAIVVPVSITMILAALTVIFVNTEETVEAGAAAMAQAYQVWNVNDSDYSVLQTLGYGLMNGLIMVTVICLMTFVIVLLYRFNCMACLIGYMIFCSVSLLGFLGGHLWWTAIQIYNLPVDHFTFAFTLWNFAAVGVTSIFYGKGIPKNVTQGYLIATSVILAWHLDYFDEVTTWTLLFMLALYDLCAVLTPCGPLKALVNLMSRDDAPEMPGLLYEAELPPEAKRPGVPNQTRSQSQQSSTTAPQTESNGSSDSADAWDDEGNTPNGASEEQSGVWSNRSNESQGPTIVIPLAVARVYNLPVLKIPQQSKHILGSGSRGRRAESNQAPLLEDDEGNEVPAMPENPNPAQLQAEVLVQLPARGGRIEPIRKNGKMTYLERDRYGTAKRILWVDNQGRVFAETEDEDADSRNTIRLGLGDFIFYSVMVGKAAEYSFTASAVCMLVILAGLGGTLVLLAVYHHALPALPISIFLGVFFYVCTRLLMQPWFESVLLKPYYV